MSLPPRHCRHIDYQSLMSLLPFFFYTAAIIVLLIFDATYAVIGWLILASWYYAADITQIADIFLMLSSASFHWLMLLFSSIHMPRWCYIDIDTPLARPWWLSWPQYHDIDNGWLPIVITTYTWDIRLLFLITRLILADSYCIITGWLLILLAFSHYWHGHYTLLIATLIFTLSLATQPAGYW